MLTFSSLFYLEHAEFSRTEGTSKIQLRLFSCVKHWQSNPHVNGCLFRGYLAGSTVSIQPRRGRVQRLKKNYQRRWRWTAAMDRQTPKARETQASSSTSQLGCQVSMPCTTAACQIWPNEQVCVCPLELDFQILFLMLLFWKINKVRARK